MSDPEHRIILVALPVVERIRELDPKSAAAVNLAIDSIVTDPGSLIDLPTGDPANPYRALRSSRDPNAPVIIYRRARRDEDGDFLVVSLMSPEQYRQQIADERSGILNDPAIREEIRVAAGTAATVAARAIHGTVTQGGAVPTTTSPDKPA